MASCGLVFYSVLSLVAAKWNRSNAEWISSQFEFIVQSIGSGTVIVLGQKYLICICTNQGSKPDLPRSILLVSINFSKYYVLLAIGLT